MKRLKCFEDLYEKNIYSNLAFSGRFENYESLNAYSKYSEISSCLKGKIFKTSIMPSFIKFSQIKTFIAVIKYHDSCRRTSLCIAHFRLQCI